MTSSQDYGQTYPAQIGSDVTPIIFGQFPRRFTFRSRPNNVIMRYIHHMQQLEPVPAAYRPLPSRPTHPIELSNKQRLSRLRRPTTASASKTLRYQTNSQVTCHYAWSNDGLATFRDTSKCVYDARGGVKTSTQRGVYRLY